MGPFLAVIVVSTGCTAPPEARARPAEDTAPPIDTGPVVVVGGLTEGEVRTCADPDTRERTPVYEPQDAGDFRTTQPSASVDTPAGWGLSVADFDGDGLLDVVLPQGGPPQLYLGDGTGRLDLRADAFPGADNGYAYGSSAADHDGDGDTDVLLLRLGPDVLWINDGTGRFTDGTAAAGLGADADTGQHAAWGDYDGDGDLDIFVVNRLHPDDEEDGTQGEPNTLWENVGGGRFADRSELVAWRDLSIGFSYTAGWWDLDGDLRPELYVINDKGQAGWKNAVARYDGETFVDIGAATGLDLTMRGMGLAASELNGDGLPDFLVSDWGELWLMMSDGEGGWYNASLAHGLDLPQESARSVAWGAELEDLDNDGDADLLVAFGNDDYRIPTPSESGVTSDILQKDTVWIQDERGQFLLQTGRWQLGEAAMGRGFALADMNGDGWLDMLRRDVFGVTRYHLQNCGSTGWLQVALAAPAPNTHGIGARVEVEAGGRTWTRWIHAGSTNLASSAPPEAHVGLGDVDVVDTLRVTWPDGGVQEFQGIAARQRVTVWRE